MIPTWQQYNNGIKFNRKEVDMSLPEYNLDSVETKERKTYPPGEYFFEIKEAKEKKGKESGNTYTALLLDVETPDGNCKVYDNIFYSEKALFKIKQIMDATGITQPKENEDYIGATGKANFDVNDKGYLEVKWYMSKGDSAINEAPESDKKQYEPPEDPPF